MPVNETPDRQGPGDRMPTPMRDASEAIEWHRQRLLGRPLSESPGVKEIVVGIVLAAIILVVHTLSYRDEVLLDQMRQERR